MTFDEFKQNVETWAAERGIYEHSTPEAQLLKALSELGELADAVIKNDIEGIKDGVGDVAVCMVNYARLAGVGINEIWYYEGEHCETYTQDRKSTRLNSSHVAISYAVFCLKKKKTIK